MTGVETKGIINVFKREGQTSHDVVNQLRKILGIRRIGHTGTLDPNVTGVLPICVGKATRVSEFIMEQGKTYIGQMVFGYETDTQDTWGSIVTQKNKYPEEIKIREKFEEISGSVIEQTPPMYSAVKVNGKRLYELAKEGKEVERKKRKAEIYRLEILAIEKNRVLFECHCSKGTYIRTLITDIAHDLGTVAYMDFLSRTSVGNFMIDKAYSIEYLKTLKPRKIKQCFTPIEEAIYQYPSYYFSEEYRDKIANGLQFSVEDMPIDQRFKIFAGREFIGFGKAINKEGHPCLKMEKVLI